MSESKASAHKTPWVVLYTTFVRSVEAIQNVNVVTNSPDAEQGQAAGASVNVQLKSGTNETHGAAFAYNINGFFTARNFFSPAGQKVAHLVTTTTAVPSVATSSKTSCSLSGATKATTSARRTRR